MLIVDSPTRRTAPTCFLVLMLALAVLAWGVRYKLSLYHATTNRVTAPAAKLLSQKERPASSSDVNSAYIVSADSWSRNSHPKILIPAITFGLCIVLFVWTRNHSAQDESLAQYHAHWLACLPRPPPALLPPGVAAPFR
jgi:hypothetical protein